MRVFRIIAVALLIVSILGVYTTVTYVTPDPQSGLIAGVSVPSIIDYRVTEAKNVMGTFRKAFQSDFYAGLQAYQLDIMPYSRTETNLVFSEVYEEAGIIDMDAYIAENVYYKDDLVGIDCVSDDKRIVYRIQQTQPGTVDLRYYKDGKMNKDISGRYTYVEDEITPGFNEVTVLDKFSYNMEIDFGLAAYARWWYGLNWDAPLSSKLLARITDITIFDYKLKSLKGIEYFKNLKSISISSGDIKDISGLAKLPLLEKIDISWCYINKLPDFSGCPKLKEIRLSMNNLRDVSNLITAPNLEYLDLGSNFIEDISPIAGLTKLKMVSVLDNCILNFDSLSENKVAQKAIDEGSQFLYSECIENYKLAKAALKKIIKDGMSDIEKERAIFDYVRDTMTFEELGGRISPFGYAGLKYQKGVCGNYAETFALLSRMAGLDVIVVSSDTHAWNAIKLDGKIYFVDTLWDDFDRPGCNYFNRSGSMIINVNDHKFDPKRLCFRPRHTS